MPVSKEVLDEIALSEAEYEAIVDRLGSEPNSLELGMFGALWSEHCGYKHSKLLLSRLPSYSPRLLVMPGAENAGVVDIGDGLAVVMKIESHNHPSAVEPFQGAATGVGGIVRDIFAMGARPIALLNSLRFGPLSEPRNRSLFGGVVAGISWYGNCIGVPDVGGEVYFSTSYSGNPLVNAMCVGLVEKDRMVRAKASGAGNLIVLVGSGTGVDGIHGASGLASRTFEDEREMRPTVQVGNPFLEKTLIEACLEALGTGYVLAMQDLGAAGLTSAVVESVAHGNSGAVIDVARAPRREKGMSPYQVMLSESQERMLVVVSGEHEEAVRQVFDKWDLDHAVIGEVTDDGLVRVYDGDSLEASLAVDVLTDPSALSSPGCAAGLHGGDARRRSGGPAPSAGGRGVRAAPPPILSGYSGQGVDISPVRPPGADQHSASSRRRRRCAQDQGHEQGHSSVHRWKRTLLLPGPTRRWGHCGGRGLPQPGVRWSRTTRHHRLPQLRQPGAS